MKSTVLKFFFTALLCAIIPASLSAITFEKDENPSITFDTFHNALGVYGTTTGERLMGGLQYQHWADTFGFQITAGGLYSPEAKYNSILDYSFIVDGLWSVYGNTFSNFFSGRLYLWGSVGHHGYISAEYTYDSDSETELFTQKPFAANAVAGFGVGIEAILFEHFSFPFQFGYTAEFPTSPYLSFSGGTGLRYRY